MIFVKKRTCLILFRYLRYFASAAQGNAPLPEWFLGHLLPPHWQKKLAS